MTDTGPRGLVVRALEPGDLGWVVQRHDFRYSTEYGWDATFRGAVSRIVAGFAEQRDDGRREGAWIAEVDGRRAGCVFCVAADAAFTAQLRLLLVEPSERRTCVGSRLVDECLRFAAHTGYTRIRYGRNACRWRLGESISARDSNSIAKSLTTVSDTTWSANTGRGSFARPDGRRV